MNRKAGAEKNNVAAHFLIFGAPLFLCYHSLPISCEKILPMRRSIKSRNAQTRHCANAYSDAKRAVHRIASAFSLLLIVSAGCAAQETNPFAGDAKAAKAGESQFRS